MVMALKIAAGYGSIEKERLSRKGLASLNAPPRKQ